MCDVPNEENATMPSTTPKNFCTSTLIFVLDSNRASSFRQLKGMCSMQRSRRKDSSQALCILPVSHLIPIYNVHAIDLHRRSCFDYQILMKFRRALDQSLGLTSYSQYTQPEATHPALVALTPGNDSAVLLELLEQECFVQRVSSSHKPLSKRQQIWTTCSLAYVELSAAFDGVCPQLPIQSCPFSNASLSESIEQRACAKQLPKHMTNVNSLSSESKMPLTLHGGFQFMGMSPRT